MDAGVDPVWAAEQVAVGAFTNAGQLCTSVERVYVHADVAEALVAALVERAEALVVGDRRPYVAALLTLEPARDVVAFRRWYLGELVGQLAGEPPRPWPGELS